MQWTDFSHDSNFIGDYGEAWLISWFFKLGVRPQKIEGEKWDLGIKINGKHIEIQCKSTLKIQSPDVYEPTGKVKRFGRYDFTVRKGAGKGNTRNYEQYDFDLLACVALDIDNVMFFTYEDLLRPNGQMLTCKKISSRQFTTSDPEKSFYKAASKLLKSKKGVY